MTNLERIRQMSAEELADTLEVISCCGFTHRQCEDCILRYAGCSDTDDIQKWLESEEQNDS